MIDHDNARPNGMEAIIGTGHGTLTGECEPEQSYNVDADKQDNRWVKIKRHTYWYKHGSNFSAIIETYFERRSAIVFQ